MTNRTFISPTDGAIFRLSLGEMLGLHGNTGGITPIPDGISGLRHATASYYSINCVDGGGYGEAESSITEGSEYATPHIKIQHECGSGRILVTFLEYPGASIPSRSEDKYANKIESLGREEDRPFFALAIAGALHALESEMALENLHLSAAAPPASPSCS